MTHRRIYLTVIRSEKPRMTYTGLLISLAIQNGADTGKKKMSQDTTLKWDSLEKNS